MIAAGTDVKPIECVVFMRMVRSRNFFEQMKGRGVRVIDSDQLRAVTPDAAVKDRFRDRGRRWRDRCRAARAPPLQHPKAASAKPASSSVPTSTHCSLS